jgi:hypothetical protein
VGEWAGAYYFGGEFAVEFEGCLVNFASWVAKSDEFQLSVILFQI